MLYKSEYLSPLGKIIILCDASTVKGVWFEHQKYYGAEYDLSQVIEEDKPIIRQVKNWLSQYFLGNMPVFNPDLLNPAVTKYRRKVLKMLLKVPYGQTISYQKIADNLARLDDGKASSARAVGGAVGHNPISILIPCHRVVGSDGALTGYAGGIERKIELLALEGLDRKHLQKNTG